MSKSNASGSFLAFTIGVTAGALAALLLAPRSGEDQRAELLDRASDGVNHARKIARRVGKRAQSLVDDAADQITDAVQAGQTAFEDERNGKHA